MGEGTEPQIPSPQIYEDDDVAGYLGGLTTPVPATTIIARTTTIEKTDFRVEFKCKNGNHYARLLRGRGKNRTADKGNFKHLGVAGIVVAQRGGYYATRWLEYQFRHKCKFK